MRIFHAVSLAIVVGATWGLTLGVAEDNGQKLGYEEGLQEGLQAGLAQGKEEGIKKGKEAKVLELAKVFAPYGYQKIKAAKTECEARFGIVCQIYGGFAPKVTMQPDTNTPKKGPL